MDGVAKDMARGRDRKIIQYRGVQGVQGVQMPGKQGIQADAKVSKGVHSGHLAVQRAAIGQRGGPIAAPSPGSTGWRWAGSPPPKPPPGQAIAPDLDALAPAAGLDSARSGRLWTPCGHLWTP